MLVGKGKYSGPANLVVDNGSDLIKVVATSIAIVGQKTSCDAREPIDDVFVADVRQAGHVGWTGLPLVNHTSVPKPLEYLLRRRQDL